MIAEITNDEVVRLRTKNADMSRSYRLTMGIALVRKLHPRAKFRAGNLLLWFFNHRQLRALSSNQDGLIHLAMFETDWFVTLLKHGE